MKLPPLRISNIVKGRDKVGTRVTYLVSPDGSGCERAIAESVVLKRWRARKMDDYVFSGARLSPTIWRAIAFAFPELLRQGVQLTAHDLQACIAGKKADMRRRHLSVPSIEVLTALVSDLGPHRLHSVVRRHGTELAGGVSGVPDLYLFARAGGPLKQKPAFSRFVEVKKPGEPVSESQVEEIEFLQSLGLAARVLTLIERD